MESHNRMSSWPLGDFNSVLMDAIAHCQLITDLSSMPCNSWSEQRHLSVLEEFLSSTDHYLRIDDIVVDPLSFTSVTVAISLKVNVIDLADAQYNCPDSQAG